ncbi:hypothetical protein RI065_00255 [Mycoplasmatota bacterium zrk1]
MANLNLDIKGQDITMDFMYQDMVFGSTEYQDMVIGTMEDRDIVIGIMEDQNIVIIHTITNHTTISNS